MERRNNRQKKGPELAFIDEEAPVKESGTFSRGDAFAADNGKKMSGLSAFASAAAASNDNFDDDDDDLDVDSSPLWQQAADQGWELTWPIWHMLPRHERKELALKHGYNTIGEFEEYMSLQQAEQQSQQQQPYSNSLIYPSPRTKSEASTAAVTDKVQFAGKLGRLKEGKDGDGDEDDEQVLDAKGSRVSMQRKLSTVSTCSSIGGSDEEGVGETADSNADDALSMEQLLALGGQILMLPEELLQRIFDWLPVDAYGILALVSPHWKHLTRTETVYQRLCERLYLNQSKKRQLHVHKFGNSYRNMLLHRPRVRAAGGCYVLKYTKVKRIQRDMWTEIPVGAILEQVYYRYLYFQEDGRVLYALTSASPHEMFLRLLKVCLKRNRHDEGSADKAIVWGTYQVQKDSVVITARQEWHTIRFELTIQNSVIDGKFGTLALDRHLSSPSGCFEDWSGDRVEYKVPEESFRFIKSSRL